MASTHLVFTDATETTIAIPKTIAVITKKDSFVSVFEAGTGDGASWTAKETFDELLKQLEE